MKEIRQDALAGKSHQSHKVGEKALNAQDLTCQEAQVEELLAKGESTDDEADEESDNTSAGREPPQ